MNPIIPFLWAAGVLHVLLVVANFWLPRMIRLHENLERLDGFVRELFLVQNAYIRLVLLAFAGLCFLFASDLSGATALGQACSGFMAFFWGARVLVQLFFYDRALKRQHPVFNLTFLGAFIYLASTFTLAALRIGC